MQSPLRAQKRPSKSGQLQSRSDSLPAQLSSSSKLHPRSSVLDADAPPPRPTVWNCSRGCCLSLGSSSKPIQQLTSKPRLIHSPISFTRAVRYKQPTRTCCFRWDGSFQMDVTLPYPERDLHHRAKRTMGTFGRNASAV